MARVTAGEIRGGVDDAKVTARVDIAGWSFERYDDGVVCFTSRTEEREDVDPRPELPMITHTVEGWVSKADWDEIVQKLRGAPTLDPKEE